MADSDDGGPAFPCPEVRDAQGNGITEGASGMSLRDYFAGQALTTILGHAAGLNDLHRKTGEDTSKIASVMAYAAADAMLAARNK